jgi:hypothetical protein
VRLTRREFVGGGAAAALAAAGIYGLVDRFASGPKRSPALRVARTEQHAIDGLEVVLDNDVEVIVPPLHHEVVTAKLRVDETASSLREAARELEEALQRLDERFESTPRGLSVLVAWGLPYFRRYVPGPAERHLPVDLRASQASGREVLALLDAVRFPSDPEDLLLEDNDLAFFFRSDSRDRIEEGTSAVFDRLDELFALTSIRRGFAGGGFAGGRSLPKRMALAAGIAGAELIPDTAELFLGFTSTQKAGMGPARIANLETLPGYTDQWPDGYFRGGSAMHLSHILEDVEAWYLNFDFSERVATTFRPGLEVEDGTQTVRQAPEDVVSVEAVSRDLDRHGAVGHSAAIQPASRLQEDVRGNDGMLYPRGTAIPQRADFNTLDNPFAWSAQPEVDRQSGEPAAGVHFVVFTPTSDDFHRGRLAMDGVMPDGTALGLHPRARAQGLNSVLETTHRQNFLVPPRRRRSFPLTELL